MISAADSLSPGQGGRRLGLPVYTLSRVRAAAAAVAAAWQYPASGSPTDRDRRRDSHGPSDRAVRHESRVIRVAAVPRLQVTGPSPSHRACNLKSDRGLRRAPG